MTLAADTREAVRRHPFLYDALRAGVVNYTAAARFLDVGDGGRGDGTSDRPGGSREDAVVAALRRYGADLPDYDPPAPGSAVSMRSGLGVPDDESTDPLLVVGDLELAPDAGSLTALVATGSPGADSLRRALGRLATADIRVEAAAVGGDSLVVVVERRDGPAALRAVEDAVGG
ncbi:MAG: hypothetical protein ABEJ40_06925 [Haloarculaceae archaeon]